MAVPPAPVRVPSQRSLSPSVTSMMSVANDKRGNEMIPDAQISWSLLYGRGKSRKTSARRPSVERAVRPVIATNYLPFLQMRSVGQHSTSGKEKEGKKESIGSKKVTLS